MISGIKEDLLKTDRNDVKFKYFRGAPIEDMKNNINPITFDLP